jgi:glycyl-tRNA synthetase beta chain
MAELLFEIFCEEIPARMQVRAGADLSKALTDGLKKAGLKVEGVQTFTGPRRLVFAADIPLRSPDVSEERKGPRVGSPEQALAGFLRGAGLSDISEAEIRTDPKKGDFYVAVLSSKGRDTKDILAELIPDIMNNFPWPKSMKSGGTTFRWVRPLQSMICLLNGEVVPFDVGGIQSGNVTEGHRRHGKGPFKISRLKDYVQSLENEGHVVLSHEKRKALIIEQARKACSDKGLELVEDEGLLNEVAGLVEWPVVILGDMDPSFLELPGEVIRLSMRTHQKYFAVRNPKTNALAPNFIVVANQDAPDGGKAIAEGNSRVLSARLADAQFFQSEDAKLKLEDYYNKLDTVVFHKKLGSIKDKAERVAALARVLAPKVGADPEAAAQAAKLAKCDLVTNMVIEFTSLEGQIGRLMYERENNLNTVQPREGGGPSSEGATLTKVQEMDPRLRGDERSNRWSESDRDCIALAIEEHYKPKGPSDAVPTNPVAVAVALADKLDTLVGFWAIDEKPTGSKDPFALRRAALGVVRIILENDVRLNWYGAAGQILLTALYYGFFLNKNQDPRQFYEDLCASYDPQYDEEPKFHLWAEMPYKSYLNDGNLIGQHQNQIGGAIIGFPWHSGDPDDVEEREEAGIGYTKLELLQNRCGELGKYAHDVHVLPMFSSVNEHISSFVKFDAERFPMVHEATNTLIGELVPFILDRLKVYLKDQGIRHDLIDAVFALGEDDLVAIVNRVNALQIFLSTENGENLLAGYKRAANILKAEHKKSALPDGKPNRPSDEYGSELYDALESSSLSINAALENEDYEKAMFALAELRAPIDAFFTHVQIISDDIAVKENNLRLLGLIRDTSRQIADFEKISG